MNKTTVFVDTCQADIATLLMGTQDSRLILLFLGHFQVLSSINLLHDSKERNTSCVGITRTAEGAEDMTHNLLNPKPSQLLSLKLQHQRLTNKKNQTQGFWSPALYVITLAAAHLSACLCMAGLLFSSLTYFHGLSGPLQAYCGPASPHMPCNYVVYRKQFGKDGSCGHAWQQTDENMPSLAFPTGNISNRKKGGGDAYL